MRYFGAVATPPGFRTIIARAVNACLFNELAS
jgi:hypothetical protein